MDYRKDSAASYYWTNFRHRQSLNSFDANKGTPFFCADDKSASDDYERQTGNRCSVRNIFLTIGLLAIFVFILQVLFKNGLSSMN